jgi:hypothetical protein
MTIMNDPPSTSEIQAHLDGLNRVDQAPLLTADTAAAKAKGIANYLQWFKLHGIEIHQDDQSQVWQLGASPVNRRKRRSTNTEH